MLCAVFVPTAFISGLTGQFYKQFALTIAISTVISAFNSLTLSPALCRAAAQAARRAEGPADARHGSRVRLVLPSVQPRSSTRRRTAIRGAVARGIRAHARSRWSSTSAWWRSRGSCFSKVPAGFVPPQDKQYLVAFAQLPDGGVARSHRGR